MEVLKKTIDKLHLAEKVHDYTQENENSPCLRGQERRAIDDQTKFADVAVSRVMEQLKSAGLPVSMIEGVEKQSHTINSQLQIELPPAMPFDQCPLNLETRKKIFPTLRD